MNDWLLVTGVGNWLLGGLLGWLLVTEFGNWLLGWLLRLVTGYDVSCLSV